MSHPNLLDGAPEGNTNALRHGLYASTVEHLEPRFRELVDAIMAEPHTVDADVIGATEIAKLTAMVEAIDKDLEERGLTTKGEARTMIDLRLRASRQLRDALAAFGFTPKARAEWLRDLASGSLADDIRRRRQEAERARQ
jgi:hypothetical protein